MRISGNLTNYAVRSNTSNNMQARRADQQRQERRDVVTISNFGRSVFGQKNKTQNFINSLMEQKQIITDAKTDLITKTLESGQGIDSIKNELKSYEEQLTAIDETIATTMLEEQKKALEEATGAGNKPQEKQPETEEELQAQKLKKMTEISGDISQVKIVSSTKRSVQGQIKVLEGEIKLDAMYSQSSPTQSKMKKLNELKGRMADLSNQVADRLENVNQKVDSAKKPVDVKPAEEEKAKAEEEAAPKPEKLDATA